MLRFRLSLAVLAIFVCVVPVFIAQAPPTPKEFFGYELGQRYTTHARCVRYLETLAERSDRASLIRRGQTSEGREMLLCFFTSAENQARLEDLRLQMEKVADPRRLQEGESVDDLIADLPVFVWLSYCVHGNETSCTEAALKLAHTLCTSDSEETAKMLQDTVVIVDPCTNPDGRDRYVNWFNSVAGRRVDSHPQSMEHQEPWPGGRFNHFNFDLNRDWAFVSQRETRSRAKHFVRWNPQVHVDYHEMGHNSSYFFFPAERPINANLPPYTMKWGKVFGRGNAVAFDAKGWDYYTEESFDLFYPGYGDSWPSFHGAIGMTYEQAGHSSSGVAVKQRNGNILTLQDRVDHHFATSMATINTAATHRLALLKDYQGFRASAVAEGKGGAIREFILVPSDDIERSSRLVDILKLQGIEVRRATASFKTPEVVDYSGQRHREKTFSAGTYLVSMAQPTKRLIKTLLEPKTEIKELYFYDIAAWSLPFSFGVEAYWSPLDINVDSALVEEIEKAVGAVDEGDAQYGYLLRWDTLASVRAVLRLLDRKVMLKYAREKFTSNGRPWAAGTVFVPRGRNVADLDEQVAAVAAATGACFVPVASGMTEKGIDLGSQKVVRVRPARVALIGGEGISTTSFGATRFLLEELYDIPYSVFSAKGFGSVELKDYTAVVVPSSSDGLDAAARENLSKFCRAGGVVVTWGRGAQALGQEGSKWSRISTKAKKDESKKPKPKPKPKPKLKRIEEREKERRRHATPGSIFKVELDAGHPLAFGYRGDITVFKSGTMTFDPEKGGTAVGWFRDAPPLSGYILPETEKKMRGRAYAMVERKGRGAAVFFADDPNFRSAWHGLTRLFLNAVLLMPSY